MEKIEKGNLFEQAKLNITPSLKTLKPHILEALIIEDLKYNASSSMNDIKKRINGTNEKDIQRAVYKLVENHKLTKTGSLKFRKYNLVKKK